MNFMTVFNCCFHNIFAVYTYVVHTHKKWLLSIVLLEYNTKWTIVVVVVVLTCALEPLWLRLGVFENC